MDSGGSGLRTRGAILVRSAVKDFQCSPYNKSAPLFYMSFSPMGVAVFLICEIHQITGMRSDACYVPP